MAQQRVAMTTPQTPEQLLASFAPTQSNRVLVAVLDKRIALCREQLECCTADELPRLQGAVAALRALHSLASGLHE